MTTRPTLVCWGRLWDTIKSSTAATKSTFWWDFFSLQLAATRETECPVMTAFKQSDRLCAYNILVRLFCLTRSHVLLLTWLLFMCRRLCSEFGVGFSSFSPYIYTLSLASSWFILDKTCLLEVWQPINDKWQPATVFVSSDWPAGKRVWLTCSFRAELCIILAI